MGLDYFLKILNPYERNARIYPAFLTFIPIVAMTGGVYGMDLEFKSTGLGLLISFGVFYLAASIVRELGKRLENSLYEGWGGKPTTQMLRHRDKTIDPVTKARYHTFCAKHLGVKFPTKAEEEADPVAADDMYQSATKWLLDQTRDTKKFQLLFDENVAYGFRRNCLGIKPFAIVISVVMFLWPLWTGEVFSVHGFNFAKIMALSDGAKF